MTIGHKLTILHVSILLGTFQRKEIHAVFPYRVDYDPVEFELKAFKLVSTTFWKRGYVEMLDTNGKTRRISTAELGDPLVTWKVEAGPPSVKVVITGFAMVCGEMRSDMAGSYSIVISGPEEKIALLRKSSLESRGFTVVA